MSESKIEWTDYTFNPWSGCSKISAGGGESGRHARPMHPDWARGLRDQCVQAGVPFFFKQWGEWEDRGDALTLTLADQGQHRGGAERVVDLQGGHGFQGADPRVMRRVGKAAAGRVLDGRTWDEVPQ